MRGWVGGRGLKTLAVNSSALIEEAKQTSLIVLCRSVSNTVNDQNLFAFSGAVFMEGVVKLR